MHPSKLWTLPPLVVLAAALAACSGGAGPGSGGNAAGSGSGTGSTPPAVPGLLLPSLDGGGNFLGQVTVLALDANDAGTPFTGFAGTPWIADPQFSGHSLVFNAADNKFYGVLDGGQQGNPSVLMAFDPATDTLSLLQKLTRTARRTVTGVLGEPLAALPLWGYYRQPLPSPDGKSLLLRASRGGVDDRGALVHVNIDAASAHYLQDTVVYDFFSFEKAAGNYCESLRSGSEAGLTELAWGKDGNGGDVVYMGVGGLAYDPARSAGNTTLPGNCHPITITDGNGGSIAGDAIKGRLFALRPTVPADLAKPWAYASGYAPFDPLLALGRHIHWDAKHQAIRWTTETVGGGALDFRAGGASGAALYFGTTEQCFRLDGLLPLNLNGDAIALCSGLQGSTNPPDTPPRIFHYTATGLLSQQANLGNWYADHKSFRGATSSLVSRRLFVNGGDMSDSCVQGANACLGKAATIEELDPATGYVQRVLATGDPASTGYNFLGDPAVGGSVREPMADRYVVWFGTVVQGHSLAINKYDRATGRITTLPFDPVAGAFPSGRLLDLGNGQALGLIRRAPPAARDTPVAHLQGTGGYLGGAGSRGSAQGYYLLDLKSGQVLRTIGQDPVIREFSQERVRLADGSLWEAIVYYDRGEYRAFARIDAATWQAVAAGAARQQAFDFEPDPFVLAARGNAALYLPFWQSNVDAARRYADMTLGCMRPDAPTLVHESAAFGPAQAAFGNAHRIVYGATWSPANQAMYMATAKVGDADEGTIFEIDKGVADASACTASPVVATLATHLADVPATRLLALRSGELVYGTANGKLMRLDVAGRQAILVADLHGTAASVSQVRGFLSEVADNQVAAIVFDYDNAGNNIARRLVTVDATTARQASRDVARLISESEPYPGVMRLN